MKKLKRSKTRYSFKKWYNLLFVVWSISIVGCKSFANEKTTFFLNDIERKQWQSDSLGCLGIRERLTPNVIEHLPKLKIKDVYSNLGSPTISDSTCLQYFISSFCGENKEETQMIMNIYIKGNFVSSVYFKIR